jgi:hypothetical protein
MACPDSIALDLRNCNANRRRNGIQTFVGASLRSGKLGMPDSASKKYWGDSSPGIASQEKYRF